MHELRGHPNAGASWEGFILEQVIERLSAEDEEVYFWAVHGGAELDLLVVRGTQRLGFEFKLTFAPKMTRSTHASREAAGLTKLYVVHAGEESSALSREVDARAAGPSAGWGGRSRGLRRPFRAKSDEGRTREQGREPPTPGGIRWGEVTQRQRPVVLPIH